MILKRLAETAVAFDISNMVVPSGSDLATKSPAAMPPAPGLFSMTTGCPNISAIFAPTVRAVRSAMPPAPKGTMIFRGLVGKLAAVWATANGAMASMLRRHQQRQEGV